MTTIPSSEVEPGQRCLNGPQTNDRTQRSQPVEAAHGITRNRPSGGCLLCSDAEQQQCLVVLLHTVPFDFTHDQLP
jgi:hypothetical protein